MSLDDLNAKLAELRQSLERGLADRVRVFDGADLATIRREAHKLRGGFPHQRRLTELAAQVEELAGQGEEELARHAAVSLCEEARRIARASKSPVPVESFPSETGRPRRILVVDDDDAIRRLTMLSLSRLGGHEVRGADGTRGVLEQARAGLFDLIIADAMMPGVGGVELALCLREEAPALPIVVLSAAAPEELGASEHGLTWWRKPISPHELVRRVTALLA
ncbi:MAG: response regulator [Polyangiales bacterium]